MSTRPYIIEFFKIGNSNLGYISVSEKKNLPFIPRRIYWTYSVPEGVERGGHSHINLEQILVAVTGTIYLCVESSCGEKTDFILNSPNTGVFIPKGAWRTLRYEPDTVQMSLASLEYDEKDYIRDYNKFKKLLLKKII